MSLILALQISQKDYAAARELCQLCVDLEEKERSDCQFWISYSQKVSKPDADKLVDILKAKFVAGSYRSRNEGGKHPDGANMLWMSTMGEVQGQYMHHVAFRETYNGIFTFEPDCVPMRADWIDALTREWNGHIAETMAWNLKNPDEPRQFEVMGHVHQKGTCHEHINGNMVLRPDILRRFQIKLHTQTGWDFMADNAHYFLSVGKDTRLIESYYNWGTVQPAEYNYLLEENPEVAVLHGIKDGSARKLSRARLIDKAQETGYDANVCISEPHPKRKRSTV